MSELSSGPGVARTVLPKGFSASGVNCGVRRYRPDLGVILSDRDAVAAGVFTLNSAKAHPIHYCQSVLPTTSCRAVITNSGQANALTGSQGAEDNLAVVRALAESLRCRPEQVLIASTGVIGVPLERDKIISAIPELIQRRTDVAEHFATAIMTTDLVPKTYSTTVELSQGSVRLTGIAKGSGMIHPNMATMLGYILTDARLTVAEAQDMLRSANDKSFNMISVDGEMSTNDCAFFLANGASDVGLVTAADFERFRAAMDAIAQSLAKSIARDGEGATKLLEVEVKGLNDQRVAVEAARSITVSPLVKTAVHGCDPNWGRIVARLGGTSIPASLIEKTSLSVQGIAVLNSGQPQSFDLGALRELLSRELVRIEINFGSGDQCATAWGCDMSRKYVEINADYTS